MLSRRISSSASCRSIRSTLVLPIIQLARRRFYFPSRPCRRFSRASQSLPTSWIRMCSLLIATCVRLTSRTTTSTFSTSSSPAGYWKLDTLDRMEPGFSATSINRPTRRLRPPVRSTMDHLHHRAERFSTSISSKPRRTPATTPCRSFTLRNRRGWSSMINYTWSHSIDNASDGQDYVANATQPDNSFRADQERGNSNFDSRHRFVASFSYDLPNFAPAHPRLGEGWHLTVF